MRRATFLKFRGGGEATAAILGGSEIPTFLSYAVERKLASPEHQKEFGSTGAIKGVAGPEAANNAAVTATLVPLLTLGLPTSVTAAILLSALQNYGIQAGPNCSRPRPNHAYPVHCQNIQNYQFGTARTYIFCAGASHIFGRGHLLSLGKLELAVNRIGKVHSTCC